MKFLAESKKAAVALAGLVALVVSSGVLHGDVLVVAETLLSVATTLGVYKADNVKKK